MFKSQSLCLSNGTCIAAVSAYIYFTVTCTPFMSGLGNCLDKLRQSHFTIYDSRHRKLCREVHGATIPVFTLLAFPALINSCCYRKGYICIHGIVICQ